MKVNTIIVSDLHLGTKDSKVDEFLEFLKAYQPDTLILNGDIIDGWALKRGSKWRNKHTKVIRKILKMAEKGTQVVWVRGNHDDFLYELIPFYMGRIKVVEDWVHVVGEKEYLVLHGDVFDSFVTKMGWVAKIGSVGYTFALWLNRWYNRWRSFRGKPYYSLSKKIKDNVKAAVSFINKFEDHIIKVGKKNGYDGVICGHIHSPADIMLEDIHYLNSGDWVENCTAIIETADGELELYYFHEK